MAKVPHAHSTRLRIRRLPQGGFVGEMDVPVLDGARIAVAAVGGSKAQALVRAASMLSKIADDPTVQAFLPPQALAAIAAAHKLASAAKIGRSMFRSVWHRLRGPGKHRIAAALSAGGDA